MASNPFKTAAFIVTLISVVLVNSLFFFVILFERDHHNRTLINKLISDIMWLGIVWDIIVQPITFYRYLVGPTQNHFLCSLDSILRNGLSMHGLLLFDSIIVTRFMFVHCIKNPTALHDDFWNLFINAWITAFWLIAQAIYISMPGKNPINVYMCIGTYPSEYKGQLVKVNHSLSFVVNFTIILHVVAIMVNLKSKDTVDQKSLFSKTTNTIGIISLILFSSALPAIINLKEPDELDQYPNYLMLYFTHFFVAECQKIIIGLAYICKNSSLRNHLLGDIKYFFQRFFGGVDEVVVMS